jgi:GTPase SAR1 family protein
MGASFSCNSYLTVLVMGSHGAGKTSILQRLEDYTLGRRTAFMDHVAPTPHTLRKTLRWDNNILLMTELGGNQKDDNWWSNYYAGNDGLIFVFDMMKNSNEEEFDILEDVLFYKENGERVMKGKPVLIMLNKSQTYLRRRLGIKDDDTAKEVEDDGSSVKDRLAIVEKYNQLFSDHLEPDSNPLQVVWTDAKAGGGIVDRLDWFVETMIVTKHPGILTAVRSVISGRG